MAVAGLEHLSSELLVKDRVPLHTHWEALRLEPLLVGQGRHCQDTPCQTYCEAGLHEVVPVSLLQDSGLERAPLLEQGPVLGRVLAPLRSVLLLLPHLPMGPSLDLVSQACWESLFEMTSGLLA